MEKPDDFEATQGGLLIPKRGHVAQRPYYGTYLGATIAALNATIAADAIALTNMTAQRDTWQSRANTAYDSGTWAVGNTWQTDYNNALAPSNPLYLSAPFSGGLWTNNAAVFGNLTLTKTGMWILKGTLNWNGALPGGINTPAAYMRRGGNQVGPQVSLVLAANGASQNNNVCVVAVLDNNVTSGQVADLFLTGTPGSGGGYNGGSIEAWFIPTLSHPN